MGIELEVNGRHIEAEKGETLLSALNRNGIQVPTICSMKDLSPSGACRMCVVEVEGRDNLVPACSFPIEKPMNIKTHSPRVLRARKTNVELLLSNHPDDCLYCERNGSCELQSLAEDLNIRERRIPGQKSPQKIDRSSPAIVRDPSKCILCGRCVRVCEEIMATSTLDFAHRGKVLRIATSMAKPLNFSNCTACGQCLNSCPTGALIEHVQFPELEQYIHAPGKVVIAQFSPSVAVSVSEMLGCKQGMDMSALIRAVLLRHGVDHVIETAIGTDILLEEQALLLEERKKAGLPLITSSCPAWVQYVEQYYPDLIPALSPLKSPRQITGSLIRKHYAPMLNPEAREIVSVVFSSCTAAKTEARRVEMTEKGIPVIDLVMTTRELARLIRLSGLDLDQLESELEHEQPGPGGSAGRLAAVAGGEAEATVRSLYHRSTGKVLSPAKLHRFRIHKPFREMSVKTASGDITMATVSGLAHAVELIEEIRAGKKTFDILEVMACPNGCVNGGGQPLPVNEQLIRSRTRAIYDMDNRAEINVAMQNPEVRSVFEAIGGPGGDFSKQHFYTTFAAREVLL